MWLLLVSYCLAIISLQALHLDTDLNNAIEESLQSDRFILSLKHVKSRIRHPFQVDNLLSVREHPSGAHFQLNLDYPSNKVVLITDEEKLTFSLPTIDPNHLVETVVLVVEQGRSNGTATVYVDCQLVGKHRIRKTLRHLFESSSPRHLNVVRERGYILDIDTDTDLEEVMTRFHCNHEDTMQADEPNRGDIPLNSECDDNLLIKTVKELISLVKRLEKELETQRRETQMLRQIIERCSICAPVSPPKGCNRQPPPCFPGVQCRDTSHGPTCGKCPPGFLGDGRFCKPSITCDQNPCFRGVPCYTHADGYRCGPCPPGYEGNGEDCKPMRAGCNSSPCSKGVHCQDIQDPPYYRCGTCPPGSTGNGTNCQDIDECDLAEPCANGVTCTNLNPGYSCGPCPPGFTGSSGLSGVGLDEAVRNRQRCYDIDECQENNGGCTPNSFCINDQGTYSCGGCKPGFTGDQTIGCHIKPGVCRDGTRCNENADCIRSGNRYICKCKIGWVGDGRYCGRDSDLDGWPDDDQPCSQLRCRKPEYLRAPPIRYICNPC